MNKMTWSPRRLARPLLAAAMAISLLSGLSGCALVVVGGAVGGAMAVSDRRTLGSQTEDTGIELKGSNRISTVFGDAVHVDVTSYNRRVLLTGIVKDEETRAKVENEIKGVENVQSVVNEIQIGLFLPGVGAQSNDALITTRARGVLVGTADIYSSSFRVVTEAGVVYLMGRVSQREGDTGAEAIRGIPGVKKVVKVFEYIDEGDVKKYVAPPPAKVDPVPNPDPVN